MKKRLIVLSFFTALTLEATSLRDSIEDTLNNNPSIIAAHINRDAYLKYVEQEEGDYLPTIDLDLFVEKSRIYTNPDTPPPAQGWTTQDGWDATLKVDYILYDGGLTSSEVGEFYHRYNANKFQSIYDVENIIDDTLNTYLDLVSSQELLSLSVENMEIHEKYLEIAKEKEQISGEVLETHQVNSKYHSVIDSYLEQEQEQHISHSVYKKLVGKELDGNICRPIVDQTFIPNTLKEAVELGLRRSYKVNEQIERIKEQREKIAQEKAGYRPTIRFEIQGKLDNDIELEENGQQDTYRARIYLNWNLYDGGKTTAATQKEELFLQEEQKKLDEITAEVVDEINAAYYTYFNTQKRVENLKKLIDDNFNILMIYKKQLADGTRTFIDILNAESELYRSDIESIDQQFALIRNYYDLLNKLSMLSDVILMQDKQVCPEYKFIPRDKGIASEEDQGISEDLQDLFSMDEPSIQEEETPPQNNYENVPSILEQELNNNSEEIRQTPKEEAVQPTEIKTESEKSLDEIYKRVDGNDEIQPMSDDSFSQTPKEDSGIKKVITGKFTINVATVKTQEQLNRYIDQYNLKNNEYSYRFGQKGEMIKLLYGSFNSVKEARKVLQNLPTGLKEYVYVDSVQKHNDLEKKYKEFN